MNPSSSMKNRIRLTLLSAPLSSSNMGCNALTFGSLAVLSDVARKLNVEFEYSLLDNPVAGVVPPELESYSVHFIDQLPDFSIRGLLRCAHHRNFGAQKRQENVLKNTDLFLDNAWGDSFSDIYGSARFASVFRHFKYAQKQGKPLILLPQTIGPFQAASIEMKAKEVLSFARVVYARDPLSVDCVKKLVPDCPVSETIDVAMFMPYTQSHRNETKEIRVGINPSGLLWKGGYTGQNQFALKEDYKSLIRGVLQHFHAKEGVQIVLIGHDIHGPNAGNTFEDYYVCKLLQREFPQCDIAPFFYSPVEAKSYISGLDLLVGSRMHCCIAAYSSGVPVFPLAYSRKFKGLFSEKLKYDHLSNLDEDNLTETVRHLEAFWNQRQAILAEFSDRLKAIDGYKAELVDQLAETIARLI